MQIFKMSDLSNEAIYELLERALFFKENPDYEFSKKYAMANLFFEPSTRTQYSFEKAMHDLGIKVTSFQASNSSLQKGESLYDTVKTFEALGYDGLVIRHPQKNYYEQLTNIDLPIISGGDGSGEHPSQCLLDLLTIYQEFKSFENLKVAIVGDIKHSRVAKSNYEALTRLNAQVVMSGPTNLQEQGYPYQPLDELIDEVDVVMLLRVQLERHQGNLVDKVAYNNLYGLNQERYERLKPNAIIMHPAPINRGVEIVDELVEADKSRIFKQMNNGVHMRKAMIERILK